MTPATVFRTIDEYHPTLLVDEVETFIREREELRGIFDVAHEREMAYVARMVGPDKDVVKHFSVWAPIALSGIGKLHATLEDRSLPVKLQKQKPGREREQIPRDPNAYAIIARKCARWRDDHIDTLRKVEPKVPRQLRNRARDNWWPMLAVADACGGDWPVMVREVAVRMTIKAQNDDEDIRAMLLDDIRREFIRRGRDFIPTTELAQDLAERPEYEGRPWAEFSRGKGITPTMLAKLLKPFDVFPVRSPPSAEIGRVMCYRLSGPLRRNFDRYLPPLEPPKPEPAPKPKGFGL